MSENIRPMTRDELVKELTELKGEISIVQDKIDLMCDEFQRIRSCPGADGEIKGLCDRAITDIKQHVPVIEQRDNFRAENTRLKGIMLECAGLARDGKEVAGTLTRGAFGE